MATSKGGTRKGSGERAGAGGTAGSGPGAVKRGKAAAAPPVVDAAAGDDGALREGGARKTASRAAAKKTAGTGAPAAKKTARKATSAAGDAASRAAGAASGMAERAVDAAGSAGTAALDLLRDLRDWAAPRLSGWTHVDWTGLLDTLRGRGHDVSDADAVGWSLERERLRLVLEGVEGMSPRRAEALVERYGTLWSIRQVGAEEIAASAGIPRALADRVAQAVR